MNRQLGDEVFHASSLVNFRNRLEEHQQSALGFRTILEALEQAGLVSRQSRQRLDSTQIFGRVARMSRLDCVRESLRLALKELEGVLTPETRRLFWLGLWERYVESQTDYRAGSETLARKLTESGTDAWQLLEWLREPARSALAAGQQAQLLARVFAEQFDLQVGQAVPAPKEKTMVAASGAPGVAQVLEPAAPTVSGGANRRQIGRLGMDRVCWPVRAMKMGRRSAPPARAARDARQSGFFDLILHPVTLAFDGDGFGVVQQAVQHGGGQRGVVVEDLGPVFIGLVGRHDGRAGLVPLAEDLEEQVRAGFIDG